MTSKKSPKFQPNSSTSLESTTANVIETETSKSNEITMQLLDSNQEGSSFEEHDWLSSQFNSPAFRSYQYWLTLSLIIALIAASLSVKKLWDLFKEHREGKDIILVLGYLMTNIASLLLLVGCGEMLFAIKVRRSAIAQKGFVKCQYSMIVSILGILGILSNEGFREHLTSSIGGLFLIIALALTPASHILTGNSVLRIFKKNHPLIRRDFSQNLEEPEAKSVMEQNEILASEVLKYDLQLKRWPYLAFQYWLKAVAVFEIARFCFYVEITIVELIPSWNHTAWTKMIPVALLCFSSLSTAYSCFLIEFAIGKKVLAKSKKAIILLLINVPISIIAAFDLMYEIGLFNLSLSLERMMIIYSEWLAVCALIPTLSLIGAVKVHKILKQRDDFAKFSSFNDDSYF